MEDRMNVEQPNREDAAQRVRLFNHSLKRAPERAKQIMAYAAAQADADYERASGQGESSDAM